MAQVDNNLADVRWITSDSFYKDKYDFVIINNKPIGFDFLLNKAKIISINGQPDEIIECKEANSEILYYKNGLYTDEFLATGKAMFTTKSLYTLIGKKIDDIIIIENASQKGIATYGPYIELKAGKYSFELVYSSLDSDESNTWDVASDSSKTILAKGELKDTNGEFKIASGEFELSSKNEKDLFIAGISSVAGDRGRASNYIYGSAKAGFSAYLSGLRNRLAKCGVNVLTIKPGFVATKMTSGLYLPPKLTVMPEQVANDIFKAQQSKKSILYTKKLWFFIMLIIKHIPEFIFKKMSI